MNLNSKIYVAGANGMVGSAIVRELNRLGYTQLLTPSSKELNLIDQSSTLDFFEKNKPEYVILAAAKVGGIMANNTYPAEFLYSNLMIEANVIHAAYLHQVKKLLFLGSSCIYPKMAPQPLEEKSLLSGPLEETNEAYAIAKITGIEMCKFYRRQYGCDFISAMPTNLYGINDNFDLYNSHLLPAMIRKFHEAKVSNQPTVEIWGDGTPMRELLYVDDLAQACVYLIGNYNDETHINIGTGKDLTIREIAELVQSVVGYNGNIVYDTTKPNGTPKKLMDVSKLNSLGWKYTTELKDGIQIVYDWYLNQGL